MASENIKNFWRVFAKGSGRGYGRNPMTTRLKIASIQINPVVGDIPGNLEKAEIYYAKAKADGADIAVFSELFIIGYAPEDLVLRPSAVTDCPPT